MTTRSSQPPQPGQRRAQNVQHADDAVQMAVFVRWWASHAEAANVHRNGPIADLRDQIPGDDHTRICVRLTRGVFYVLPCQAAAARNDVVIQEDQRLRWIDT